MASLALPPPNNTLALPTATATPAPAPAASTSKPATSSGKQRGSIANASGAAAKERSITPDEDDDEEEEEEDEPRRKKKKAGGGGGKTGAGSEYKYQAEIAAMMFVFGEVQEPLAETTKLVEDVVRGQIIEIVTRARLLTHLRSSRSLSAEDLIFLIREDRGKVNRLRTYLSWKDVRKKAKEDDAGPGADVDVDLDGADAGDKSTMKGRKTMIKLPWELMTPYSEYLRGLPTSMNKEDEEEDDEDEIQAHQDSMQRLREADEITKKMTKDEYVHYSDCRQASFTYRKARRFREFINFAAYLDVRPNDDIVDILGFLAFEMVRSLCVTALDVRARHEEPLRRPAETTNTTTTTTTTTATTAAAAAASAMSASPVKRKSAVIGDSPNKRTRAEISPPASRERAPVPLFAAPPSARQPLTPAHVLEAYAQIQRQQAASRVGGMRNFRGSITKGRMALV